MGFAVDGNPFDVKGLDHGDRSPWICAAAMRL